MNDLSRAWVLKAECDFLTASRELAAQPEPNFEAVGWHAHQCALKYLRARLAQDDIPFPSTHHLVVLLEICLDLEPSWWSFRDHLRALYNGIQTMDDPLSAPDRMTALKALDACRAFRDHARVVLED